MKPFVSVLLTQLVFTNKLLYLKHFNFLSILVSFVYLAKTLQINQHNCLCDLCFINL